MRRAPRSPGGAIRAASVHPGILVWHGGTLCKQKAPAQKRRSESLRGLSPAGAASLVQVYRPPGFGVQAITMPVRVRKRRRPGATPLPPLQLQVEVYGPEPEPEVRFIWVRGR